MKHFTKPFFYISFSLKIFIISSNFCKSAETTTIWRIFDFRSDIYTLYKIKQVKKIKCAAVLIQAKIILYLYNCPQDNYYILHILNETY